jgi:phosphatidylinositol phospholipase C, delta
VSPFPRPIYACLNQICIVPIESIKEIRTGQDARYYLDQFQLSRQYEDRWLTLVYILDGKYKTLHVVATTREALQIWDIYLGKLYGIRKELMSGLGNVEVREAVWERQYWKSADVQADEKLEFEEVERLCRRLNINSGRDDLKRLFKVCITHLCLVIRINGLSVAIRRPEPWLSRIC